MHDFTNMVLQKNKQRLVNHKIYLSKHNLMINIAYNCGSLI